MERKIKPDKFVSYLEKENAFLRGELAKMSELCLKLASSNNNNLQNPPIDQTTPSNLNQETSCQFTGDTPFVIPRRTSPLYTPAKNSWKPNMRNAYSALSVEDTEEGHCNDAVKMLECRIGT